MPVGQHATSLKAGKLGRCLSHIGIFHSVLSELVRLVRSPVCAKWGSRDLELSGEKQAKV